MCCIVRSYNKCYKSGLILLLHGDGGYNVSWTVHFLTTGLHGYSLGLRDEHVHQFLLTKMGGSECQ